jgi:hypothetical protein
MWNVVGSLCTLYAYGKPQTAELSSVAALPLAFCCKYLSLPRASLVTLRALSPFFQMPLLRVCAGHV